MSAIALRPMCPPTRKGARRSFERASRSWRLRIIATSSVRPGRRAPTTNRLSALASGGVLTLLAMIDGAIAGFASLKGADEIDMLFVEPEFARQGVGRTLVDALTRLAQREAQSASPPRRVTSPSPCSSARASLHRSAISCALATSGWPTPR